MTETGDIAPIDGHDDDAKLAQIRAKVRGLRQHIIVYVVVNAVLFLIDIFSAGGLWFIWPLLGWGIGLAAHWISVMRPEFLDKLGKDWEDRTVERLAERGDE